MSRLKFAIFSAAISGAALTSTNAHADSERGMFFVQLAPAMLSILAADAQNVVAYHADLDVGIHFDKHHEGVALGLHQAFNIGDFKGGVTQIRGGYDIAIPISNGDMELTLSPHGKVGVAYGFDGGDPLFAGGFGFEGRFFFIKDLGLFAMARPLDIDFWVNGESVIVPITFAIGAGYAF
jgi:hypothetical protein